MAITANDIKFYYSVPTATAGYADPQADPTQSLGGFISTTEWAGGVKNDVFPDVTPEQNSSGLTDYRCVFIRNLSESDPWMSVEIWLEQIADGSTIEIGLDPGGIVSDTLGSEQGAIIASSTTPPAGVVFGTPGSGTELNVGNLTSRTCQAIWIKRTTNTVQPITGDGFTIRAKGVVI
jgi:hypothetical protein